MKQLVKVAVMLVVATAARAQTVDAARNKLIADARAGTTQYQNVNVAIADGFKRVGVEFPAMGEHWVSLSRILENRFNPRRPTVLIYITNHGKRQLAGVGYTALLGDRDQPPRTAAQLSDWHEHNGSVIDESLPVHGHSSHSALPPEAAELGATRLAILHAWVWTKNPAGPFVTENWSLPLVRLGAHRALSPAAVRTVSLANDSVAYYEQTLTTALQLNDAEAKRMRAVVDVSRLSARAEIAHDAALDDRALAGVWNSLWSRLEKELPTRATDLKTIRAKL